MDLKDELELILSKADARVAAGKESIFVPVVGPSGAGKTAIVREFLEECRRPYWIINGTWEEAGDIRVEYDDSLCDPYYTDSAFTWTADGVALPVLFSSKEVDKLADAEIIFIDDYDWCIDKKTRLQLMRMVRYCKVIDIRPENKSCGYLKKLIRVKLFVLVFHEDFERKIPLTKEEQKFFGVQ